MPAPETPTANSNTGSQQQLDAMIAEMTVPILATSSPRLELEPAGFTFAVAPGNWLVRVPQQFAAGSALGSVSLDIVIAPCLCGISFQLVRTESGHDKLEAYPTSFFGWCWLPIRFDFRFEAFLGDYGEQLFHCDFR